MSGKTPMLAVQQISVRYRRGRRASKALDGVTFDLRPGETVGLVGESGSGKSTAAKAILGLVPVHAGSIYFDGADITHLAFRERRETYRHIQIVFQDPHSSLNPSRTIGDALAEPLEAFGERDRTAIRNRVFDMLERVQVSPRAADRYPWQFSGGQRQRIAIARALMLSPRLVILDEAVSSLDVSVQAQVLNLLQELQETSTLSYLFISHDLGVVRHMCSRVVVLYRGRVMESGPIEVISGASSAHPYTYTLNEAVLVPNPKIQQARRTAAPQKLMDVPGETRQTGDQQCLFAPRCPWNQPRCWRERPLLRSSYGDGAVACHRYPEWRREVPRPEPLGASSQMTQGVDK
ncbi:MAG TPA: ABC transporter ATP-binding protein [Chloroflexota bacterium]